VKRDNVVRAGFEDLIRVVRLQIALVCPLATMRSIELRSVTNPSPRVEVRFAGTRIIETFQYDESGKTLDTRDRTFVDLAGVSETRAVNEENNYRWVDLLAH
jgi:hypothetical protein